MRITRIEIRNFRSIRHLAVEQFWGPMLKSLQIPPGVEAQVQRVLDGLNKDVLDADPRLRKIAGTLRNAILDLRSLP